MGQLSVNTFLTLADSLAKQAALLKAGFDSFAAGTANNTATLLAAADIDVEADLAPAFRRVPQSAAAIAPVFYQRLTALDMHLGGIGYFLADANARVAPEFRDLLWRVPPAQVFPPTTQVAHFTVTGSGAGTFTHDGAIDTTQFGPAAVELVATDQIGAAAINVTLTLTKLDGTSAVKTATIPANSANGTVVQVDGGAVAYTDCTAITITGGTGGDSFKVATVLERVIAL